MFRCVNPQRCYPREQHRKEWFSEESGTYTDPEEVIDFATRTGCDSLAISIGTSHGAYKFTPEQCTINEDGKLVPR